MARQRPTKRQPDGQGTAPSRLAGFGARVGEFKGFQWGEADTVLLAGLVVAVTRLGGLASFGVTRDGGAGTITVFLDEERSTEYIKPTEDVDEKLAAAIDYFDSLR